MTTPHNPLLSGDEPEKYIPFPLRSSCIQSGMKLPGWLKNVIELTHQDIYFTHNGRNIAHLARTYGIHPYNIHEIIQHQASVMKAIKPSNANEQARPTDPIAIIGQLLRQQIPTLSDAELQDVLHALQSALGGVLIYVPKEQAQPCTCHSPNKIADISDLTRRSVVKPLQSFLALLDTPDKHHCPAHADLAQLANSIAAQLDQLLSLLPTGQVPHRR